MSFENVSKRYALGSGHNTMREAISALARRAVGQRGRSAERRDQLWALKDLSFEVGRGEALGIIGPNGAGKTTVLKLLSGLTKPTFGNVRVEGRVASLIELGAGFHPDLSGRENVYLNGAILGLRRREIDKLFDTIIEFAELEPFVDTPVKRYSSGMFARLGFSVAAHVNPEILLVDEVLSVGDIAFQARCTDRMKDLRRQGSTMIFISHNMHSVIGFCDRCIVLDRGKMQFIGSTDEATKIYQRTIIRRNHRRADPVVFQSGRAVDITRVEIFDELGQARDEYELGETLVARIHYRAHQRIEKPLFSAGIYRLDGVNVCSETSSGQLELESIMGPGVVELIMPRLQIVPGIYTLATAICEAQSLQPYTLERLATFQIVSMRRFIDDAYGIFVPDFKWRLATSSLRLLPMMPEPADSEPQS